MKIGIITFHAVHNFGAVLQAYGLQEFLKSQGHEVYVVDYRPKYLADIYKPFSLTRIPTDSLIGFIKSFIREVWVYPIKKLRERYFNAFIKEFLQLHADDFQNVCNDFDAFVFGSDQIWNPIICNGLDPIFLGDFPAAEGRLLVSYAGSLGSLKHLTEEQKETLVCKLNDFNAISCREKELSDFIAGALSRQVATVLDPVLLAGRTYYESIASKIENEEPYLLFFTLQHNENARQIAYNVAKERNLKVVEIMSFQISVKTGNIKHSVSVPDFLGYIRSAEFVVTSSFHGTALSVLFAKDFFYVSENVKVGERVINMLQTLGIQGRVLNDGTPNEIISIDYKPVFETLDRVREDSSCFIRLALG